jgi:ATP-binding cassette subfamily B protein
MPDAASPPGDARPKRLSELKLIWGFLKPYRAQVAIALIALVAAATLTLAIPQGFKLIVDRGFNAQTGGSIAPYFEGLIGVVVALGLASATRFYYVSWLGERVIADIRSAVGAHLVTLHPGWFEENRPSEIASRVTADTGIIEQLVGTSVSVALRNAVLGLGGLGYMAFQSLKLTGLVLLVIPVLIGPAVFLGRRVRGLSRQAQDRVADIGATTTESLGAIKIVQSFTQEARTAARFGELAEAAFATARRRIRIRAALTALMTALIFGAIVLVLWEGAADVIAGRMSGGAITAFVLAAGITAGAFGALTEVYGDIMRAIGASQRIGELLSEQPAISPPPRPVPLPVPPRGSLSFENVEFRYPTRPQQSALIGFTLRVTPGETVALVGPSGAGKSTVFQLAQRFYDPLSGEVRLDGVPLPSADPVELRQRIGFVPQEPVVFAASAIENIRFGRPDASLAEVWAAAEAANAAEFLAALPDGLNTYLGEGGARLSGGQRQRMAIARAVLKDAPLLLLDEATSALDAESERLVQDALERLMAQRTTLVIAHRLATVRNADRIIVLDGGRIVDEGTHDALVAKGGLYARLARLQFDDARLAELNAPA